ncbi:MAG: oligosaccharide flippase family protein [Bacteroidales bacterium]|nr:oligosaccharide flippase family protein [Bacteroidales bacterium]
MTLKQKMAKGVIWTSIDRVATQLVQFVIGIVIARIVSPTDYGVLAILMIFISLSQIFVDSGFGKALIQKNNLSHLDCSTAFWFNLGHEFNSLFNSMAYSALHCAVL